MRHLNFDIVPEMYFGLEHTVVKATEGGLKRCLKADGAVSKIISRYHDGEPFGLVVIKEGKNPASIYEEGYIRVKVGGHSTEIPVYYCSPKEFAGRVWQ